MKTRFICIRLAALDLSFSPPSPPRSEQSNQARDCNKKAETSQAEELGQVELRPKAATNRTQEPEKSQSMKPSLTVSTGKVTF